MSGKSKEEVAFELLAKLKGVGIWGENNLEAILDMYSQCLEATSGLRALDGKIPVALKLQGQTAAPVAAPAPRQAAPAPAQPVVRQQQQQLQQALQQSQVSQAR